MAPKQKTRRPVETPPQPPAPNWPAFTPLVPTSDLALDVLLPRQIITLPTLWTATLCRTYVSFLSSLPLVTTPGQPKKGYALRVNDRFEIHDPAFAERLWSSTALKDLVTGAADGSLPLTDAERKDLWGGDVVGLSPRIRIYRYSEGQFFDQHYDDFNDVMLPGSPPVSARTTWTLLLYLTSPATGCHGGETVFYPEPQRKKDPTPDPIVVGLQVGMALLHRHGADCMLHEGREVTKGEKWIIRTDLCVRR